MINTAYESYNFVPLEDSFGKLVTLAFNGSTNTLKLGRPGTATADCNANFLMLVPVLAMSATPVGTNMVIAFPTQSGFNYQVQYKNNLADANWSLLGNAVAGDGAVESINDPATTARFYRLLVQ